MAERTPNLLTMDTAAYRIDGGAWQPEKAVILIQQELLAKKRPCRIDLRFTFTVQGKAGIPQLELLLEQPQQYTLTLNGAPLPFADNGWAIDRAFRRCVIGDAVREGENELILSGEFFQRQEVYDVLCRVEGDGHLVGLHFHTVADAAAFAEALNARCIDSSAQLYKANCPPAVLLKPPVISSEKTVRFLTDTIDELLNRS